MGDSQDQDQYEDRLRELFNSFDSTGCGSLSSEELLDLCESLHLHNETPALLQALLQDQDRLTARVDFDQFKHALILVLSSNLDPPEVDPEPLQTPESPEIQPKFVKGSKRYGRRSTPEFMESTPDDVTPTAGSAAANNANNEGDQADLEDNDDSAVPRKRERWNAYETETEEYEAEGQMHLWNPDEPGTPRGAGAGAAAAAPLSALLEERLRQACDELNIRWDGRAGHADLLELCERLGLEELQQSSSESDDSIILNQDPTVVVQDVSVPELTRTDSVIVNCDVVSSLSGDGVVSVQEFVSRVLNHNKPATPSSSTPYRQLKRLHSTQPFDEGGRRIVAPCALTSSIGTRLFSVLDDGSGFTAAERVLDAWLDEGIENSAEILQALNFDPDGRLSLGDLTVALENELLVSKDGIQRAAVASFRAEIRHLLERVDREIREKDKIRSDLEKAERLKTQFAAEVDEHHAAMEADSNLHLRKLEQEHREKVAAVRSDLMKELDRMQQQAGLQREELETEIQKVREDEAFLRDHLSISVKENRRLEVELLDTSEKLVEAQSEVSKLQTNLDTIMKDKFGDLDPSSADFLLQEERIKQLRGGYEAQCRELQDRIDELQSELQEFHGLGRTHQSCNKPLSEELESKSPGMESDPGIGSEEVQPFSMSLEAEMMLEQLKEQHLQEMEDLRNQLENKITKFDKMVEKQRATQEDQKAALSLQYQQEVQALQVEVSSTQRHAQELQDRLDRAEQERSRLQRRQAEEREELENLQDEEVGNLRQQLLEAHNYSADLEEQLKALEEQLAEAGGEMEEQRERHVAAVRRLKEEQEELLEARLAEAKKEVQEEKVRLEQSLETERKLTEESHREELEEVKLRFEEEREEAVRSLTEEWRRERTRLDEQSNESLQALLEDEMLRLVREQEEKEARLQEQWEQERAGLREQQEEVLLERLGEERLQFERRQEKLREEWEKERLQLEEDYEGMIQDRLSEEREKLRAEEEDEEERVEKLLVEEKERLQESHREAVKELRAKHAEERDAMSATLDKLRDDIAWQRCEVGRLSEENVVLRQKIAALKAEDSKEVRDELTQTLDHLNKEKKGARKAAETFKKQISELRSQNRKLEDENRQLREKTGQNATDVGKLHRQLAEENQAGATFPVEERNKLAACVCALEAELNKALEDTAHLEQRNIQLSHQLCEAREKVKTSDETLQVVNHRQGARLKSDLRVMQQETDSLKHEVAALNKQLQNANDKNHVLEVALHSGGLKNHGKKSYRDETSRLREEEQQLLRQENERLQEEARSVRGDLVQTREKVRQLDATVVSLRQQKLQVKTLEQENVSLKLELEAQKELNKDGEAGRKHSELESLQQENEALKAQMTRLSSQLLEAFQAQLVGLLPPSPHRIPRGQHRGEDPDNMQDGDREKRMKIMEERMREIELSLHNVKLLLREKVAQLKDQVHKNGKADVLIKDLYVENSQLLKALEITEQRQKIAEKKNYLLEEKISSLNKIVRDLNPSPLSPLPYHYKCS